LDANKAANRIPCSPPHFTISHFAPAFEVYTKFGIHPKPTIVWDFHSLMLGIHMMFSFLLTDENHPMKLCKHCHKVFIAKKPDAEFCSTKCRNSFQKK